MMFAEHSHFNAESERIKEALTVPKRDYREDHTN